MFDWNWMKHTKENVSCHRIDSLPEDYDKEIEYTMGDLVLYFPSK